MDINTILPILNSGGILGLVVLIIVLGSRKDATWVYGWQYRAKSQECEAWRQLAVEGIAGIKSTLDVIEPLLVDRTRRR